MQPHSGCWCVPANSLNHDLNYNAESLTSMNTSMFHCASSQGYHTVTPRGNHHRRTMKLGLPSLSFCDTAWAEGAATPASPHLVLAASEHVWLLFGCNSVFMGRFCVFMVLKIADTFLPGSKHL